MPRAKKPPVTIAPTNPINKTAEFETWFKGLKDRQTQQRIATRIDRLSLGHPGDVKPIGKGASELKMDFGPGYRVYYLREGDNITFLLGGDKSTQKRDIARALAMLE